MNLDKRVSQRSDTQLVTQTTDDLPRNESTADTQSLHQTMSLESAVLGGFPQEAAATSTTQLQS